ncbi:MAG TPA: UvrD-helicase domain-containing protein [Candidatus Hydrogenedentes bacterium]|nr:UvrD-helicase domain-containing protein [Candidatus Hydrogenedentota bacterium]HIJ74530.1 UvrD-helicase domain-containing protein [Candidatus Hydrogenedentota bacterium]
MDLTAAQTKAITAAGADVCVDAGAGSGKTLVLVERIVHLLEGRCAKLDEIVAITFTRKAADEMKERLRKAFHARAPKDDPDAMTYWRDLEQRVETARVSTIHSFCASVLRANALALGIDPDFVLLEEAESVLLRNEAAEQGLHLLLDGNDEALFRLGAEHGTARVGKAVRHLLAKRQEMERICAVHPLHDPEALCTHWQQLVRDENATRLKQFAQCYELDAYRADLVAFDGECEKEDDSRELMRRAMIDAIETIRRETDPERIEGVLRNVCGLSARGTRSGNWPSKGRADELKDVEEVFKRQIDKALPKTPDPEVERRAARLTCDMAAVYGRVNKVLAKRKDARTARDFDDLIIDTLDVLRRNDDVRSRVARGIKYLLIDEFQDTDSRQLEIVQLLSCEPDGPEVFYVGDAKQSIYGFRGAQVEVMRQARDGARHTVSIDHNFRTLPGVLAFVNEFFRRSALLEAVESHYGPLVAHRTDGGSPGIEFLAPLEREVAVLDDYREAEADLIAWRIAAMCSDKNGAVVFDKETAEPRPARFGDVAILFRSTTNLHIYERSLRQTGIPFNVVAGAGFYERQEIIDIRNLIAVILDPWDEWSLLGLLRSPIVGLSDESLLRLCADRHLTEAFLANGYPEGFTQAAQLDAARKLVAGLTACRGMSLTAFIHELLDRTGYEAIVLSEFLGLRKAGNVRKLLDLAARSESSGASSLGAFLRYVDEVAAHEIREGEAALHAESADAVSLLTIHKAKGLEWPIVVIPDLGGVPGPKHGACVAVDPRLGMAMAVVGPDGKPASPLLFDAIRAGREKRDVAERARLLYVAMTRARDRLILAGAPSKNPKSWMHALDSQFDLLSRTDRQRLSGDGWEGVIWRDARPRRHVTMPEEAQETVSRERIERQIAPVALAASTRATFSVTELLDALGDEESAAPQHDEALVRQSGTEPRRRGEMVHAMLERWDLESDVDDVLQALCRDAYPAAALDEALLDDLKQVGQRVQASSLGKRMAASRIQREVPFMYRVDDAIVTGVIDALLEDGTLVDYKTGRRHPDMHARYEWQLRVYAAAMAQLTGRTAKEAVLCYVDTPRDTEMLCPVDINADHVEDATKHARRAIQILRGKTRVAQTTCCLGANGTGGPGLGCDSLDRC